MNPRYLAYCRAHGRTSEEMLAFDKLAWPSGHMNGFILWLGQQWREFESQHTSGAGVTNGERALWRYTYADAFDVWLQDGS